MASSNVLPPSSPPQRSTPSGVVSGFTTPEKPSGLNSSQGATSPLSKALFSDATSPTTSTGSVPRVHSRSNRSTPVKVLSLLAVMDGSPAKKRPSTGPPPASISPPESPESPPPSLTTLSPPSVGPLRDTERSLLNDTTVSGDLLGNDVSNHVAADDNVDVNHDDNDDDDAVTPNPASPLENWKTPATFLPHVEPSSSKSSLSSIQHPPTLTLSHPTPPVGARPSLQEQLDAAAAEDDGEGTATTTGNSGSTTQNTQSSSTVTTTTATTSTSAAASSSNYYSNGRTGGAGDGGDDGEEHRRSAAAAALSSTTGHRADLNASSRSVNSTSGKSLITSSILSSSKEASALDEKILASLKKTSKTTTFAATTSSGSRVSRDFSSSPIRRARAALDRAAHIAPANGTGPSLGSSRLHSPRSARSAVSAAMSAGTASQGQDISAGFAAKLASSQALVDAQMIRITELESQQRDSKSRISSLTKEKRSAIEAIASLRAELSAAARSKEAAANTQASLNKQLSTLMAELKAEQEAAAVARREASEALAKERAATAAARQEAELARVATTAAASESSASVAAAQVSVTEEHAEAMRKNTAVWRTRLDEALADVDAAKASMYTAQEDAEVANKAAADAKRAAIALQESLDDLNARRSNEISAAREAEDEWSRERTQLNRTVRELEAALDVERATTEDLRKAVADARIAAADAEYASTQAASKAATALRDAQAEAARKSAELDELTERSLASTTEIRNRARAEAESVINSAIRERDRAMEEATEAATAAKAMRRRLARFIHSLHVSLFKASNNSAQSSVAASAAAMVVNQSTGAPPDISLPAPPTPPSLSDSWAGDTSSSSDTRLPSPPTWFVEQLASLQGVVNTWQSHSDSVAAAHVRHVAQALQNELDDVRRAASATAQELQAAAGHEAQLTADIEALQAERDDFRAALEAERKNIEDLKDLLGRLRSRTEENSSALEEAKIKAASENDRMNALRSENVSLHSALAAARGALMETQAQTDELKTKMTAMLSRAREAEALMGLAPSKDNRDSDTVDAAGLAADLEAAHERLTLGWMNEHETAMVQLAAMAEELNRVLSNQANLSVDLETLHRSVLNTSA